MRMNFRMLAENKGENHFSGGIQAKKHITMEAILEKKREPALSATGVIEGRVRAQRITRSSETSLSC